MVDVKALSFETSKPKDSTITGSNTIKYQVAENTTACRSADPFEIYRKGLMRE
jgi:hypothetical protein